jgi:uncharacterized repeat protein (TIGR04138 family)
MTMHHAGLAELVRRDPRYAYEAYEFVFDALDHTLTRLGRKPQGPPDAVDEGELHVTAVELLEGACELAQREFGLMARVVLSMWGIRRTDDIGGLVFNLIEAGLMNKNEDDRREDFNGAFDMARALSEGYAIQFDEANL